MSAPRVAAVVLAAGAGSRMGSIKQLLPWRGRGLLVHAVETALGSRCRPVLVVLGCQAGLLRPELDGRGVDVIENAGWAEGLGSSIALAARHLLSGSSAVDAAILMLADQPLVSSALLDQIVELGLARRRSIVACEYGRAFGPPALFDRSHFRELAALRGDKGAKGVIARHRHDAALIPFPGGEVDIDTPADYEQLR